jgi:hypothetical protein
MSYMYISKTFIITSFMNIQIDFLCGKSGPQCSHFFLHLELDLMIFKRSS